jgi:hypothetical protein
MTPPALRAKLRSLLWDMLAAVLDQADPKPLSLRVRSGDMEATASIGPPATQGSATGGLQFSGREWAIVQALSGGKALIGKQIAAAAKLPFDGRLKVLLVNLVDRKVLQRAKDRPGYQWAKGFRLG